MSRNFSYEDRYDPPPLGVQLRQFLLRLRSDENKAGRHLMIAGIMAMALFAFEAFNFDTTRYALANLIGDVRFANVTWASILAIAFCSIDFAGLIRIFSPDGGRESKEAWYLVGAWLLGATMNAMMTWWAVSLTLLDHQFGNEILSRDTLLRVVPIFVAALVWLTRVLFIGAITYSGEMLRNQERKQRPAPRIDRKKRRTGTTRTRQSTPVVTSRRQPVRIVENPQATSRRKASEQLVVDPPLILDSAEPAPKPRKRTQPKQQIKAKPKPKTKKRGLVRPKPQRA